MESKEAAAQQLRELERAEAAPYIDYPPTPRWYASAVGVWSTLIYLYLYAVLVDDWGGVLSQIAVVVLVLAEAAFIGWYSRFHGAMPAIGRTPAVPEIRRVYGQFLLGFVVVLALVLVASLLGVVVGAVVTLVLVVGGLTAYERVYAAASRAARERMS